MRTGAGTKTRSPARCTAASRSTQARWCRSRVSAAATRGPVSKRITRGGGRVPQRRFQECVRTRAACEATGSARRRRRPMMQKSRALFPALGECGCQSQVRGVSQCRLSGCRDGNRRTIVLRSTGADRGSTSNKAVPHDGLRISVAFGEDRAAHARSSKRAYRSHGRCSSGKAFAKISMSSRAELRSNWRLWLDFRSETRSSEPKVVRWSSRAGPAPTTWYSQSTSVGCGRTFCVDREKDRIRATTVPPPTWPSDTSNATRTGCQPRSEAKQNAAEPSSGLIRASLHHVHLGECGDVRAPL